MLVNTSRRRGSLSSSRSDGTLAMSRTDSLKLMVVGTRNVGKSALVVKYLTGRFIGEYRSDIEMKYDHKISIDGEEVHMEILDTVTMEDHLTSWAEGFMIVYDVTNRESFERVIKIRKDLEGIKTARNMSLVIVANKTDLIHCRRVDPEEGENMRVQLATAHFECCACGSNDDECTMSICEAFEELCREIQHRRRLNSQARRRRRSSLSQVKQSFRMLVNPNKNKNSHLSPSSSNGSIAPSFSRRGSAASAGRRDSGGRLTEHNNKHLLLPQIEDMPIKLGRSQSISRSMSGYFSGLSVKQ